MRMHSQSRNVSSIHTVQIYEICTLLGLVVIPYIGTVTMSAQEALALLRVCNPVAEVKIDASSCAIDIVVDEEAKLITLYT